MTNPRSRRPQDHGSPSDPAERRGRRLSVTCRLCFFGEEDFEGETTTLDLSTGGCQAPSLISLKVGTILRLSPRTSAPLQSARATVVVNKQRVEGKSFGLEFTEMRSTVRERIRAMIMKAKL